MTLTQPNVYEGYSTGERTTGSTEDGERLWRTSAKGQERLTRHGSYEGRLNSRRVWVWAMSYLRARAACSGMHVLYMYMR